MRIVSEQEFSERAREILEFYQSKVLCVTGPGRSGAVASVYASHFLKIPFIPWGTPCPLEPVLIIDTAVMSGETLRRAARRVADQGKRHYRAWLFDEREGGRVTFWYEHL